MRARPAAENPDCLARSVTHALAAEPTLEAVTINQTREKISVATLGRADEAKLAAQINATVEKAQTEFPCGLLEGREDCATCAAPLASAEREKISVTRAADTTTIARVTCPTAPHFWRWRDLPFPRIVPREVEIDDHDHHPDEWKWQIAAAALCGALGLLGAFVLHGQLAVAAFALAYLAGAWFTAGEVWERLQQRKLDVHFLMLFVAAGAACIGAWAEGTTLLFLFSLSGALEHYALGRTRREINSLFKDAPKLATLIDAAGHEKEIPVEQLRPGMRLLVRPDAQFPVDADIARGETAADESNLTGEAAPVDKRIGDSVLAGTINLWGAVEVTVTRPPGESALQKIIKLIHEAQHLKAPAQRFTDKFGSRYTYAILALTFAMFFVWRFALGLSAHDAFYRTMTLLVVASPCALVLSIPSAVLAAIAWGARRGILFRGGAAVEKLAEVQVVAMDKTGTLTTGELKVERVESFPPGRENEIALLAYSLEKLSTHPLARAITRYGKQQQLAALELAEFESVTGLGLRAKSGGKTVLLGRWEWISELSQTPALTPTLSPGERENPAPPFGKTTTVSGSASSLKPQPGQLPSPLPEGEGRGEGKAGKSSAAVGLSEVWIAHGALLGRIVLRDDIRPQARVVVEELRREGLQTVVLTGDRRASAEHLKTELGLDDVRAELKPEGKVAAIREFTERGLRVAMVGDGVNDAPSLAAAHVGVAMGARGSDAALEQAEVVLMNDKLENFLAAFRLSQRARSVIRQNLVISLGTVAVLVLLALLGKIPLTLGVVGHEGSTVVVVMNSLRLLLGRGRA